MNPTMIMDWFYNLKDQGLTVGWLIFIGCLFTLSFILSARELIAWFLKINSLRRELSDIKDSLHRLEKSIKNQSPASVEPATKPLPGFQLSPSMPSFQESKNEPESKAHFNIQN